MSQTTPKQQQPAGRPLWALRWPAAVSVVLVLALAAQGTRGLWEPDEGFYATVALAMSENGDWLIPRLHDHPFLDKPPLHYWGMALGLELFGVDEWSVRLAHSLWFAGTALLVGLFARRLWGPRHGPAGAVVYATMLGPFAAANALTPDTVLTFCVTAMALGLYLWDSAARPRDRWIWATVAGISGGLGLLAKGPALLVFAFPLALYVLLRKGLRVLRSIEIYIAVLVGLLIGLWWYGLLALRLPGSLAYFFDNQIAGRLWTSHYHRDGEWWGALRAYVPIVVAGTLPWTLPLLRAGRSTARRLRRKGWLASECRDALLLALWFAAPFLVLFLARSRLMLYALPVLPALALIATKGLLPERLGAPMSPSLSP